MVLWPHLAAWTGSLEVPRKSSEVVPQVHLSPRKSSEVVPLARLAPRKSSEVGPQSALRHLKGLQIYVLIRIHVLRGPRILLFSGPLAASGGVDWLLGSSSDVFGTLSAGTLISSDFLGSRSSVTLSPSHVFARRPATLP